MKRRMLLAGLTGPASFLIAGAALAAPPAGFTFTDYTVNAGVITPGACPVGFTCQVLKSDVGFMQQRITDGTDEGTFFRTIITESDASAVDPSQVEALPFLNDSFVGASNNTNSLAVLNRVQLEGALGSGFTEAEIARGVLNTGEPSGIRLRQFNDLVDRTIDFNYEDQDDGSRLLRIDAVTPTGPATYSGPMTVRRTSGSYTACDQPGGTGCLLELPDGQTIAYDSGDDIGVVYQHQSLFSMGPVGPEDRVFENQSYENATTGQSISWTNASNNMLNGIVLPPGQQLPNNGGPIGGVTFNTINADGGAWDYWDANFGTAPSGVIPPAGFPSDPFSP